MILILLCLTVARADDTTPPSWPGGAWLEVGEDQALYDQPANTTEELLRRQQMAQVHVRWPAAVDDVAVARYRLLQGIQEVASLSGDSRMWSQLVQVQPDDWQVVAVDAAGNESAPLCGRLARWDVEAYSAVGMGAVASFSASTRGVSTPAAGVELGVLADGASGGLLGVFDGDIGGVFGGVLAGDALTESVVAGVDGAGALAGDPLPNVSVRVGREGSTEAFFEQSFHFDGGAPKVLRIKDHRRDLRLEITSEGSEQRPTWRLFVYDTSTEERIVYQINSDPLSLDSQGNCALDTDFRYNGGLWFEWGVDPRRGDPAHLCRQMEPWRYGVR